jgi:PAS domain S-box-containing protein
MTQPEPFESIFEHAVEGIFQTHPNGRYIRVNPALARIYGYESPQELMGGLTDIASQLYIDPDRRAEFMAEIEAHDVVRGFEAEIRRKDATTRWISENARAVRDLSGHLLHYEGFVVDITERKESEAREAALEEELHEAHERMALAELAQGIAHDFRTLIHVIDGHADMAREKWDAGASPASHLDQIGKAVSRATELVERIASFGKDSVEAREPVAVDALLRDVVRMVRASMPPDIDIRQQLELDTACVYARPSDVFQVIVNLCTNAVQAMGDEGVLSLSLSMVERANHSPRVGEPTHRPFVCLAVGDTGPGLDGASLSRLTESGYTTRADLGGRGLGLAIVRRIVEELDGALEFESDSGAVFKVYIPVMVEDRRPRWHSKPALASR